MKKIVAFTGSNSSTSINRSLLNYAIELFENVEIIEIDLRKYDIPIFGEDLEKEIGAPAGIKELVKTLNSADAYLISSPEHNSIVPAFFKNILDWLSRQDVKCFGEKPILLLGTSPGKGGALNAIKFLEKILPYSGGLIQNTFSLPSFYTSFIGGNIIDSSKLKELTSKLEALSK